MAQSWAQTFNIFVRFRWAGKFWTLWMATLATNLADGVFKLSLPLLAASLTTSPGQVAGVAFVLSLPWLILALPAGAWADRTDRRRLIIGANALRVTVLSGLVVAIGLDQLSLPFIYGVALLLGIAETVADTAAATVLPMLVPAPELERANARLVGGTTVMNEFLGPALGGALAGLSMTVAFGFSAGLYGAAAFLLLLLVGTFRPAATIRQPLLQEIITGVRYVWRHDLLRTLLIILAVMNLGWGGWLAIMVLYVVEPGPGGLSAFGYGILLTSIGIGGAVGAFLTPALLRRFGRRWGIAADIAGTFTMLIVPALTANPWAIGAAAVIGGMGGTMWSIVIMSLRQQIVPDALMGRVGGVARLFGYGGMSLGALLAGSLAEIAGIPTVFAVCAVLTGLLFIPFGRYLTPAALSLQSRQERVPDLQ